VQSIFQYVVESEYSKYTSSATGSPLGNIGIMQSGVYRTIRTLCSNPVQHNM
jgi:hypothetical protein